MYSVEIRLDDELTSYEATVRDYGDHTIFVAKHKRPAVLLEQVQRELTKHLSPVK